MSNGITLEQYSEYKKLPIEILQELGVGDDTWNGKPAVRFDHYDQRREYMTCTYRIALEGDRFRNEGGAKTFPYLLHLLPRAIHQGYIYIVEGESNAQTLAYHGLPVIGIGGAKNYKSNYDKYFYDIPKIYFLQDPDKAGEEFKEVLASSAHAEKIKVISLMDKFGVKDVSDFHMQCLENGENFTFKLSMAEIEAEALPPKPNASEAEAFAEPLLINAEELEIPEYPFHVFPEDVRQFIQKQADAMNTYPEWLANSLLAFTGGTVGKNVYLQVTDTWKVYGGIWGIIVGDPSTGKSPAINAIKQFVDVLQSEAFEEFYKDKETYKRQLEDYRNTKKNDKETYSLAEPIEPRVRHYLSTNPTIESIAPMLESSAGITNSPDEIMTFLSFDQYKSGKGSEKTEYMTMYDSKPLKVDRKNSDSIRVETPVVSVIGGIQPDVLIKEKWLWERADGFIDRILWSYPSYEIYKVFKPNIHVELEVMQSLFRGLSFDQVIDLPIKLTLSAEALDAYGKWYSDKASEERRLKAVNKSDPMLSVLSKAEEQTLSIALDLHMYKYFLDGEGTEVSAETLQGAIAVMGYHIANARKVRAVTGGIRAQSHTNRIAEVIGEEWVTKTELHKEFNNNLKSGVLDESLEQLLLDKVIEEEKVHTPGAPLYRYRKLTKESELEV